MSDPRRDLRLRDMQPITPVTKCVTQVAEVRSSLRTSEGDWCAKYRNDYNQKLARRSQQGIGMAETHIYQDTFGDTFAVDPTDEETVELLVNPSDVLVAVRIVEEA